MKPERFGRYRIMSLVGAGGMSEIHLAEQVGPAGFCKPCVLKRISRNRIGSALARAMFMEEARLSSVLNHPNIIQTFDFGEVLGVPFMAMEFVDGVNLALLCRQLVPSNTWLPRRLSVELIAVVLGALEYAHEFTMHGRALNIVHRDVSPQNILISRDGWVKLADFGIARHDALEQEPAVRGKRSYAAPEQAMGLTVDRRADIFSAGIILVELLSGRRATPEGAVSLGPDRLRDRIERLLGPEVPEALRRLLQQMTAFDRDARCASAGQAMAALTAVAGQLPSGAPLPAQLQSLLAHLFPEDSATVRVEHDPPTQLDGSPGKRPPAAGDSEEGDATVLSSPVKRAYGPDEWLDREMLSNPKR